MIRSLIRKVYWKLAIWRHRLVHGRIERKPGPPLDIAVTVLTYKRPTYLYRTLVSFFEVNRDILPHCRVIVLNQTSDPETEEVLAEFGTKIDQVMRTEQNIGCGRAYTLLMQRALELGCPYILHLEDDFESREALAPHLPELVSALDRPELGAVRLRSVHDTVKDVNWVTGESFEWRPVSGSVDASTGHFTFNPTLVRREVIERLLPVGDEAEAIRVYHHFGLGIARLKGDAFVHIGDQRVDDWKA